MIIYFSIIIYSVYSFYYYYYYSFDYNYYYYIIIIFFFISFLPFPFFSPLHISLS